MATRTYSGLWLISLEPEQHAKTCGYWYLVQMYGATPCKAFASRSNLFRWLDERGLKINEEELAPHKQHSSQRIEGEFRESHYLGDADSFWKLAANRETRQCDNAQYTLAKITTDPDGVRHVHLLNCNVKDRPVFDYQESRAMHG